MRDTYVEDNIRRACKIFSYDDVSTFELGMMHGLAYPLDLDNEYKTVMMLVDYIMKRISMEG